MIPILYNMSETAFTSNGVGRLRDCISCTVTEERNGIYECDFEYPVTGAHYSEIIAGMIVGVTHDDTGIVEPFDIVSYTRPINGVVTFHAVHVSYRLSGLTTWGTNVYSSETAMSILNAISGSPFSFSADFITEVVWFPCFDGVPRTARQLMGGVEGSILDVCGGEWQFERFNATLHKARGEARDFTIRYGVNMSEYQEDADYSETYNSVVPFWTDGNGLVVRGSRYDADLVSYNGRRVIVPLDLSDKFENKPTVSQLNALAWSIMDNGQTNLPTQSINVSFIRLQESPQYDELSPLLRCNLCDTVNVVFPVYGMRARMKIVKTVWNVLADRYNEMELGTLSTTLSEALGINQPKAETASNRTISGNLVVYNGQSGAQMTTSGTSSHAYIELTGGAKTLRLVSNTNGNIGLYDPTEGKWIIRNDTNGATYLAGRSTPFKGFLGGTIASTSVTAGTYVDVSVTFSEAFDTIPTVVCSINSTSTSTDIGSITASAINATTTGFTIRIFNNSANRRAPAVSWIAFA